MYPNRWIQRATETIVSAATILVFTFLDILDLLLCVLFRFVDTLVDGHPHACYCHGGGGDGEEGDEISKTLYGRKNLLREMGLGSSAWRRGKMESGGVQSTVRWSDCGCQSCVEWTEKGESKLYFVTREPSSQGEKSDDCQSTSTENVIFIHGFLCSSTLWVESVFQNISEHATKNYRLFAVDLLGFGRSPKPTECLYRLKDHTEMIEKSVIEPLKLKSFHLVAHSMGCIIAVALAAKHPDSVKSITLVAPPYIPFSKEQAEHIALNRLAGRKLWPPILFGSAVMSWYEHLGRCICFIICRNHKIWELGLKLLTRRRNLHFMITDSTKHTHHSAWHTMHNVICGGAKLMDAYLETLNNSGTPIKIIQGDKDQVVPPECSFNLKLKAKFSELESIQNADHSTVIINRERDFTRDLEEMWFSSAEANKMNLNRFASLNSTML